MQKLTPGTNKTIAILIRVILLLTGGSAIIAGLCLFGGDMWMLTPRAEQYQPATGDLVDVVIYEPSKFIFALLYVFIITLVWLLAVRKIPWRPIQHPILALIILIAAGIVIFLHPEVTPGRDASIQYGKHNISYTAIFGAKRIQIDMSLNPINMKFLLKRKIPAGLSTETILAAPGAVKSSGIPSFTPCHSMRAGFRTAIRRSWPASVLR
ncbi:hypothetical protein IFY65_02425 [Klebsiella pneumoniae]|nr:hypothetical protein IFY65_02425 [Klebsiella pneumoniae]